MKKHSTFLSTIFVIAALFISCAGTSGVENKDDKNNGGQTSEETQSSKYINTETKTHYLTSENVKLLGRSYFISDWLWMPYSSTGVEFNVNAKRLDVTFTGDSGAKNANETNAARVAVFVNGERKLDELIFDSEVTFTVFDEAEEISGEVQILKISEAANSTAGIACIALDKDGTFSPTTPKDLKIEFIGDSITCGYGVDDLNRNNHFKTSTEDNTKTYAYKAAKALNADYSMVSISGWGIISGYTGNDTKNAGSQLPQYYDKLGFSWGNSFMGAKPQAIKWDFSQFQPDIVVINLGTNDASYTKGKADRIDEYKAAYIEFLKTIREKNPDAHIICSLGIMGQDLCPAVESVVTEYKALTGDEKITYLKFANQNQADGIAADWHPSEKTHTKAATLLVNTINEILE